jgi:hypothetical protein
MLGPKVFDQTDFDSKVKDGTNNRDGDENFSFKIDTEII